MKRTWSVFVPIAVGLVVLTCVLLLIRRGSVRFQAGKSESHNMLASASTSSADDYAAFSARHVVLIRDSHHALIERISTSLIRQLTNCPQIVKLSVIDSERDLPGGTEAPDMFIRLTPQDLSVRGVLSSSVKATVTCSLGTSLYQSSHSSHDAASPPLVRFHWNARAENSSRFTGMRSDRLAEAAESIARDFGKGISNQIALFSAKHPAMPALPRSFFGPYEPVADLAALKALNSARLCSYFGLLTHNETFWAFETPPAFHGTHEIQRLVADLESEGWKCHYASLTNTHDPSAQFTGPEAELNIMRIDRFYADLSAPDTNAWRWVAHYRKPFSRSEREAVLETLLAENAPVEKLLPFRHNFSQAQQKRFYIALETAPAASPRTCIHLAEHYLHERRTNEAVRMLVRAEALSPAALDLSSLRSDIDRQAARVAPDLKPADRITPELCRELGFIELTNGLEFETERELGQPVLLFSNEPKMARMAFFVGPPQKKQFPWKLVHVEHGSSGHSSSFLQFQDTGIATESFSIGTNQVQVRARLTSAGNAVKLGFKM